MGELLRDKIVTLTQVRWNLKDGMSFDMVRIRLWEPYINSPQNHVFLKKAERETLISYLEATKSKLELPEVVSE